MNPAEIEFLAERETISIVPNFNEGLLYLLEGDVGPFKAGIPVEGIPIWMAVNLSQRQKCRIVQPEWLDIEKLENVKEAEKESPFFTAMPHPHLFVLTNLIMDVAIQDISSADQIRTLLKDIWDIRQAKLRKSVEAFIQSGQQHAQLDHLQLIELNTVRPLLPQAMNKIFDLEKANAGVKRASQASMNRSHLSNSFY